MTHRLLDALLEQGALRQEGRRVPDQRRTRSYAAAKKLTDPADKTYGFVARGLKNANVPVWTSCCSARASTRSTASRQAEHRRRRGDRGGQALPEAAQGVRAAAVRRLQLERVPDLVHAGPRRDVARRHRLRDAARGPDQVQGRRQGRLRRHADGPEGAALGDLRRRRSASRPARKKKGAAWLYVQWATNKANQARHAAGGRRRHAGAHLGVQRPEGHGAQASSPRSTSTASPVRRRSAGRACRRSSR